jgi:ABC-type transport system involved in multi-copper enzyme maturation permease subunit
VDVGGYRGWTARLRPAWVTLGPIALTGLRLLLRRKLFWMLLAVSLVQFLFLFALIYARFQLPLENPGFARFIEQVLASATGAGKTYRDFMERQGTVTMVMLAFAGELLVGSDYRQGGLTFYLARRVARRHYVLGKLLGIALLVELTTTVPALILYLQYGVLGDSLSYFRENPRILMGILGYGLVLAVTLSLLLFALAAWLQRTVPLVMAWACIFALLPAFARILRSVYDEPRWLLLNLWRDLRLLGTWCFGALDAKREEPLLGGAVAVVVIVCVVSAVAIIPRVRAVKVVS